jgi:ornithine lipid ester-linked acyl 2-hydroxylase
MTATTAAPPPRTLSLAGGFMPTIERLLGRLSQVGDRPFFASGAFPWVGRMESFYPAIRGEVLDLLKHDAPIPGFEQISTDQVKLSDDRRWKTYFFLGYGLRFEDNIARCPATWAALKGIPGLTTAFFSVLEPGKRLPPHRGPYKGVLRYHLGIVIPERADACGIDVDGERRHWREGTSLIFDDTFIHSAWNDTAERRIVLFVDFARPLRFPANLVNRAVLKLIARSGYVQEAKLNYRQWKAAQQQAN